MTQFWSVGDACRPVAKGHHAYFKHAALPHWPLIHWICVRWQLFPYHLADYVCRVLRVTPFRYYCDLLFTVMREEKSYDQIPNFTVRALRRALRAQRLHVLWNVTTPTTLRGCERR